jgi:hypothetical protein
MKTKNELIARILLLDPLAKRWKLQKQKGQELTQLLAPTDTTSPGGRSKEEGHSPELVNEDGGVGTRSTQPTVNPYTSLSPPTRR